MPDTTLSFDRPAVANFAARTTKTDAEGRYRILLPAGIYTATMKSATRIGKSYRPRLVKVRVGRVDRLDFHIDTGIR